MTASVSETTVSKILRYFRRQTNFVSVSVNSWAVSCKIIYILVEVGSLDAKHFTGGRQEEEMKRLEENLGQNEKV